MFFLELIKQNKYDIINYLIILSLLIAFPISLWEGYWYNAFLTLLAFILILFAWKGQERYEVYLPGELQLTVILFIYIGLFLGGAVNFYDTYPWLDSVMHFTSGLGLGFVGFLIPYSLYKTGKLEAPPVLLAIFGFSFALSLGSLWEMYEFGMDSFFSLDMQRAEDLEQVYGVFKTRLGLLDTMKDLLLNAGGTLIASFTGYLYLKKGEFFLFAGVVDKIEKENPRFFDE